MFSIQIWTDELISRLKAAFGARLIAVGLQGSFKRGEAHDGSDIDVVVVLDKLTWHDLTVYKEILAHMPASSHPACGFISGQEDLKNWSRAELFQFTYDTDTLYGSFDGILSIPARRDALEAAQTGAGTIFHALCHTQVHGKVTSDFLAQLYKGTCFVLQALHFAQTGEYVSTKQTLLSKLTGLNREILATLLEGKFPPDSAEPLLAWCQETLAYTSAGLRA
uniref:Polymerase nucleotidyl transferase domain-containing protein n=1 Tax=uncultured Elusimicrobia bacterium TaxID=699876 RepID=A0A650EMQ3_9BACT|nr:hypothetical protein Elusimicrob1349_0510 [uncultured Elusimicrobia bacterium]